MPKYLIELGLKPISAMITIVWCIGVFLGGLISGYLGDKLKLRTLIMPPFNITLLILLIIITVDDDMTVF